MPEYRAARSRLSFLELCKDPDAAAEVTVGAAQRLGVDAAILFADILLILEPLDIGLDFRKGDGPIIRKPVRSRQDVAALPAVKPRECLPFVFDAVRKARAALPPDVPLIGFAGAPFTVASYLIEGRTSRNYVHTKSLMYRDPEAWHELLRVLAASITDYLIGQIEAGAQAVQLFDSWAGCLAPSDYREYVLPHTRAVVDALPPDVPLIHFATGTAGILELVRAAGGHVIGIDWRIDLGAAWKRIGYDVAIQGNLDPAALLAPPAEIRKRVREILDAAAGRPGHVFNLGHGILPETPIDHVRFLVDTVHELSAR